MSFVYMLHQYFSVYLPRELPPFLHLPGHERNRTFQAKACMVLNVLLQTMVNHIF